MNGDGAVTFAGDRYAAPLGHPYYGGLTNSFTYKNLTLDVSFLFNHRMGYINNSSSYPLGVGVGNQPVLALQRWMTPGDNSVYPGATTVSTAAYSNPAKFKEHSDVLQPAESRHQRCSGTGIIARTSRRRTTMPRYLFLPLLCLASLAHATPPPTPGDAHDLAYSMGASLGERLRQEAPEQR